MAKEQLLQAVEDHNANQFLKLILSHEKKSKSVDLEEILLELSQDEVTHIWGGLQAWADEQITAFIAKEEQCLAEAQGQGRETAADDTGNTSKEPKAEYNEKLLESIVKFGVIYVNTHKDSDTIFIPEKFLELTLLMHEMMTVLDGAVKVAVVALCELWWLQDLETRDLMIANTLFHLVEAAIRKGAQVKDVVRLWKIHDALDTMDLISPSKRDFVEILTSTASCPVFLKCDAGIKWLVKLFSWPSLIGPLHKEIRLAIPECTNAQSEKYGEIYFKAWKVSQGDAKKAIEEDCIQDLMYTAIHANPMPCRPSANLHRLLHHIHSYKKQRAASTLITELYQPILWRSFKVANGYVRMNATGLLCDAFPMTDYTLTHEEQGDFLEKQYHTLKTMLLDPCHLVRITAIKGVFNILSKYWIMVPSEVIKAIFKILLTVLVYDVSTAAVRVEVLRGLTLLLSCVDAVPFLSQVLPRLGNVFDDANAVVRETFARLLLKVKESKALKYWDIVSVNHLLHRLELDNPKVAQRITRLLLTSFHPLAKGDEALLQSSLSLLEENRMAARKFYQHASSMIGLPNVVHFILLLWLCVANHIAIHRQQHSDDEEDDCNEDTSTNSGRRGKHHSARGPQGCGQDSSLVSTSNKENAATAGGRVSNRPFIHRKDYDANEALRDSTGGLGSNDVEKEGDEEEESENDEDNPLNNPEVLGGILDTVGILWATNAHRLALPQNLKYLEALRTKISKNFHHFFRYFKGNADASQTLLYIASFLPKSLVPTLVGHCMSQLKTVQADKVVSGEDTSYRNYVNALCNWNHTDSVLELVSEWLEEGFKSSLSFSSMEKRRSRRQVRFCETSIPKPHVALHFLLHILEHPLNRVATLQRYRPQLLEVIQDMAKVKDMISTRLQQSEELSTLCSDKFLCECWSLYLRLVVVCHHCPAQAPTGMRARIRREEAEEELYLDSPACILECLEWASSTVVPYLGERSGGKRRLQDTEEVSTLITSTLKSLATSSTHLLMIGAAKVPFVYMLNGFIKILLETDKNGVLWEEGLFLAQEGYEFLCVYESNEEKEESAVTPLQLANTCIASMSEYFKHHDQLPKECKELNNTLVQFLVCLGQRSRQNQSQVLQQLMAFVAEHLNWRMSNDNGEEMEVESVQQVGGFVALLLGAFQNQTKLSIAVMDAFTQFLTTDVHDIKTFLAACHLLKVLLQDSGKISRYSLKQAVTAASTLMSTISLPERRGEETDGDSTPNVYEKDAQKAQEILDGLKNSLGIV